MLADDVLDMAFVASLRPATLVVAARHLIRLVRYLDELGAAQAEDLAPFAADDRDERAVTADERNQRRHIALPADRHVVDAATRQRERAPEVLEGRGEDGDAARAVALEALVEPPPDPHEVRLERLPLAVGQHGLPLLGEALGLGKLGVDPRLGRSRGRSVAGLEIDVEADRAPAFCAESRQLAKLLPGDPGHDSFFAR